VELHDEARDRLFPCEIWTPDTTTSSPLIVYSHSSGANRNAATFLCTHLGSHGYVVAALDHSETFVPELRRPASETAEQRASRIEAVMGNRVPDIRLLLDEMKTTHAGLVGHSLGGWTVLATPEVDARIDAIVALAPGGASNPRPGILPAKLTFAWGRDIPTLYLVAENDVSLPLEGMYELFDRTPSTKQLVVLRRADHMHFMDNVEEKHEAARTMNWPAELAWIKEEIRPISELCSGEEAHRFVRGLTLAHFDATLRRSEAARQFLASDDFAPNLS
jgi:pimeloyl-ACP methyl ester carboxylesterase